MLYLAIAVIGITILVIVYLTRNPIGINVDGFFILMKKSPEGILEFFIAQGFNPNDLSIAKPKTTLKEAVNIDQIILVQIKDKKGFKWPSDDCLKKLAIAFNTIVFTCSSANLGEFTEYKIFSNGNLIRRLTADMGGPSEYEENGKVIYDSHWILAKRLFQMEFPIEINKKPLSYFFNF